MPHGYKHANLKNMPLPEAQKLIGDCLDIFSEELKGFNREEAVFSFPYNASSPELEEWLPTRVRAFRTGGGPVNPLPHAGQVKLTCTSHGPENIDTHLEQTIDALMKMPSGWLIYNTHGLDDEGWGPMSSGYLDELLDRYSKMKNYGTAPGGYGAIACLRTLHGSHMIPDEIHILIIPVIFFAALIRSTFGFGDALVAMPLLSSLAGLTTAVPLAALTAVTISTTILIGQWREVQMKSTGMLIVSMLIGIPFGLYLLKGADETILKLILSFLIIAFSLYRILHPGPLYA